MIPDISFVRKMTYVYEEYLKQEAVLEAYKTTTYLIVDAIRAGRQNTHILLDAKDVCTDVKDFPCNLEDESHLGPSFRPVVKELLDRGYVLSMDKVRNLECVRYKLIISWEE